MATKVTVLTNGPLMLKGEVELTDAEGKALPTKPDATYLCRCGGSAKKPFCDGTHKKNGFQG
ncbi:MAG: CDGSH iron-sulfur domain-containing protein [Candidatus Rokubacteria bacterium]|nr:CDGSH iron-sulfur domain-containing protein [Candidatus Rokubacteria bacterium]